MLAGGFASAEPRNCWEVRSWMAAGEGVLHRLELGDDAGIGVGNAEIIRVEGGRPQWSMAGDLVCSNGISICMLLLPLVEPAGQELAIQVDVQDLRGPDGRSLCVLALSHMREQVNIALRRAMGEGGGLTFEGGSLGVPPLRLEDWLGDLPNIWAEAGAAG